MDGKTNQPAIQAANGQRVSSTVTYTVSKTGVASVPASEVLRSKEAQAQLAAVAKVREAVAAGHK